MYSFFYVAFYSIFVKMKSSKSEDLQDKSSPGCKNLRRKLNSTSKIPS